MNKFSKFKVVPSDYITEGYFEVVYETRRGDILNITRSNFNGSSIDEIIDLLEAMLKDLYEQKEEDSL